MKNPQPKNTDRLRHMKTHLTENAGYQGARRLILNRWVLGAAAGLSLWIAWGIGQEQICTGYMYETNWYPAHVVRIAPLCRADCSVAPGAACEDYYYDPANSLSYRCDDRGGVETGVRCVFSTYTIKRTGRRGEVRCNLKPGCTNECQLAGECVDWRDIGEEEITVFNDSTSSEGCRVPPLY